MVTPRSQAQPCVCQSFWLGALSSRSFCGRPHVKVLIPDKVFLSWESLFQDIPQLLKVVVSEYHKKHCQRQGGELKAQSGVPRKADF